MAITKNLCYNMFITNCNSLLKTYKIASKTEYFDVSCVQQEGTWRNWPIAKARVGHLKHYVNGEILGSVLFSSEIK